MEGTAYRGGEQKSEQGRKRERNERARRERGSGGSGEGWKRRGGRCSYAVLLVFAFEVPSPHPLDCQVICYW